MGIVDEDVKRVRDQTDIVQLITQHTQLKKNGRQWMGLCPFHGEKSPSFSVNHEKGLYYCFGCQTSGDVIDFVRQMEHLDFAGSVEYLASRANIPLRYTDKNETQKRGRRKELLESVQKAVDFYHDRLLRHPDGRAARDYLRERGYDSEVARQFSLGWAPEGWDNLAKHLNISADDMQDAGLGGLSKRGTKYDFFRERIVFPIFDERGDAVGFGGRKLPDGEGPKYKNTSDAAKVYSKSRVLYGLNWAKTEAGKLDEIIVCEGYTDVIGFHLAGIERAVATCGTAMTPDHARKLKLFASRVVLAYDADGAGQAAAERVYAWEEEFGLQFAVADLPEGSDPGDMARNDPEGLRRAVEHAKPFLAFRIDRELARGDLSTVEGRARAGEAAVGLVAEHPNALVRDQYLVSIADQCGLDAGQLRRRMENKPVAKTPLADSPVVSTTRQVTTERQALRLLMHRPSEVAAFLSPVLFADPTMRLAYEALAEYEDLHEARAALEGEAADVLSQVAVDDATDDDPLGVVCRLLALAAVQAAVMLEGEVRRGADMASLLPDITYLRRQAIELREVPNDMADLAPALQWFGIGVTGE
ncbi:MAG: DNA primase [Acidimicrobiales bacterium]|nr:DNA primase [Acidimicrobiales bacterium]